MTQINDIQRRPLAKQFLVIFIYGCFLFVSLYTSGTLPVPGFPFELMALPIILAITIFQNRIYLFMVFLLGCGLATEMVYSNNLHLTHSYPLDLLLLVIFAEVFIFLNKRYKVKNAQLINQAQTRIDRLSALRSIDLSMTTNNDLKNTLSIVIDQLRTQLRVDAASIYVLNQKTDQLEWKAGDGYPDVIRQITPKQHPAQILPFSHNPMTVININQTTKNNEILAHFSGAGFSHYVALPLVYNNVLLGTMEILNNSDLLLDDDFNSYLETLAGQAAIAIEHATSFNHLQEMNITLQATIKELIETKDVLEKSQRIGRIGNWRYKINSGSIEWSDALYEIYGITSRGKNLTYATIFENIVHEDVERVRKKMDGLFLGESIFELEYRILHADGEIRHLITMCEAFCDENNRVIEIIGTIRDRTEHKQAELLIHQAHYHLQQSYDTTLEGWARALDLRDHGTEGHSQRVTRISLQLAEILQIPVDEYIHIRRGAILHDIGKIGIPDTILLKPGKLTDKEWQIMRKHPQFAYDMLSPISYLHPALDIPYCHHEKWNGSGYPQGLKGTEIPLSARIFAIVDVLDALCSDRPYRKAWSLEAAKNYLVEQSGTHFDPDIVEAFVINWNRINFYGTDLS